MVQEKLNASAGRNFYSTKSERQASYFPATSAE